MNLELKGEIQAIDKILKKKIQRCVQRHGFKWDYLITQEKSMDREEMGAEDRTLSSVWQGGGGTLISGYGVRQKLKSVCDVAV